MGGLNCIYINKKSHNGITKRGLHGICNRIRGLPCHHPPHLRKSQQGHHHACQFQSHNLPMECFQELSRGKITQPPTSCFFFKISYSCNINTSMWSCSLATGAWPITIHVPVNLHCLIGFGVPSMTGPPYSESIHSHSYSPRSPKYTPIPLSHQLQFDLFPL